MLLLEPDLPQQRVEARVAPQHLRTLLFPLGVAVPTDPILVGALDVMSWFGTSSRTEPLASILFGPASAAREGGTRRVEKGLARHRGNLVRVEPFLGAPADDELPRLAH